MKRALACILLLSAALLHAETPDVHSILANARPQIESADYKVTSHLILVDAKGTRTSYSLTIKAHKFPDVLRVLVDVSAPAKDREQILFEMHPGGESSILVAHPGDATPAPLSFAHWSDGVLSSEFNYEDFLESDLFWPGQTSQGEMRRGARDCIVLKSTPGSVRSHYSEARTWLDKTIWFPVYAEKTLKTSGDVKEFTYFGLRHDEGVWSASQIQAQMHGKPEFTLLTFDRGSAKAHLTAADFAPSAMTHF